MDRAGWVVWAMAATLIAASLGANAVLLVDDMAGLFEEQSKAFPQERPWYFRGAGIILAAGAVLLSVSSFVFAYGWGKVRAKGKAPQPEPKPLFDDDEDRDPLQMPPGFMAGPKIRTKRHGLVPLVGFNLLGLLVLAGGGALVYVSVTQFVKTVAMDGAGFKTAILWGRLLRFAGLPLMGLSGLSFGLAWGRWFPLGQLEVIKQERENALPRASRATWDRQA